MIKKILIFLTAIASSNVVAEDFVQQILEPTGGKIDRPKNWYYLESHDNYSWNWILSREKADKSPYDVGVRIQVSPNVSKITGKSAKQFILEFKAQKIASVKKIFRDCSESDQGLFTRVCLETQEGKYRILYSLFWGNNMDLIVTSISGAPSDDWKEYEEIFNHMSKLEIIDMTRFSDRIK